MTRHVLVAQRNPRYHMPNEGHPTGCDDEVVR